MSSKFQNITQLILFSIFCVLIYIPVSFCQVISDSDICNYYQIELENIPHEKFTYQKGRITFSLDGKEYPGCQLTFVSNDSLLTGEYFQPRFVTNFEKRVLYQQGWRQNNKYTADGPGSSVFGIEQDNNLCLLSYGQPASLSQTGDIEQSSVITITVESIVSTDP